MKTTEDKDVCPRRSAIWSALTRPLLAGFGMILGVAGAAAGDRAAGLLPPQPASPAPVPYVSRGSGADLNPDELPPPIRQRPRDPGFKYPPTYSSKQGKDFPEISKLWDKVVSGKVFGADEEKKPAAPEPPKRDAGKPAVLPVSPTPVNGPLGVKGPLGVPPPAWGWYGYGAPTPGANPLAPQGIYGAVPPSWYHQTGATPGAIPLAVDPAEKPLHPILPLVSGPALPPARGIREQSPAQDAIVSPGQVSEPTSKGRPAELDLPGRPAEPGAADPNFTPVLLPVSHRDGVPQARGQAPDKDPIAPEVVARLRAVCAGSAEKIELSVRGREKLSIRLKLLPGTNADRLADLISRSPELAGYEVEMFFSK